MLGNIPWATQAKALREIKHVYEVRPRKESRLKKYLVCAMVSVLGACQTPTASNQGTTSSKATIGTGPASPSSRYDVDTFGPLLPPNFPRQQGGSVRGP